ncbi:unnamed protein product [Acanthoscelides obtectus]|nr:unnamed protein product [Acanthoscelides obtectus]CAK1671125.1 hypothetical protein AOBTE_LOCUS28071 [Acanthoscelides obtectus]
MCSFAKICFPLMDQCTPQVVQSEEEACTYVGYPEYFHCTRAGLFRNLNDVSCNTYHHCKYTEAGTLIKETYQCLGSSKFNPHAKKCDRNYQCPCNGTAAAGNTENQLAINNQLDQDTNGTVATKEYDDVYERNDSLYMLSAMRDNMLQFSDDKSGYQPNIAVDLSKTSNDREDLSEFSFESLHLNSSLTSFSVCNPSMIQNFQCIAKGRFQDQNDLSCRSYFLCNLLRNGSFVKTKYVCPQSSRFNPNLGICDAHHECPCDGRQATTTSKEGLCLYEEDPDYFACNRKGRVENLNDLTCQSYFLCNQLRNGSFVKTKYLCPKNSYFDPVLGICSTDYSCPCNGHTTTVLPSTTTYETTKTTSKTTTGRVCSYEEASEYLYCNRKGRFENLNDLTCQSYYLCNLLRNGSFIRTKYPCPQGSYFNPSSGLCDTRYTCPCNEDTDTSSSSTAEASTIPTTSDRTTEADDQLPTEEPLCNYQRDPDYFTCTNKGRFENLNDLGCESYFLCNLLRNGSFVRTKYPCPKNSYFNPVLSICSTAYNCPCNDHTTAAPPPTRTDETTKTTPKTTTGRACSHEEASEYFNCYRKGRFENLNDLTCQSYYLCNLLRNGSFIRTKYSCPKGSHFNPSTSLCDTRYTCPCNEDTDTSSSSTTEATTIPTSSGTTTEADDQLPTEEPSCNYQGDSDYFTCTNKGRFENLNDLGCESYFLCNLLRNGSFVRTKYPCPKNSYFDPVLSICSTEYKCPCYGHTTTVPASTRTDETTETATKTTSGRACNYEEASEYFNCYRKGRFENFNDLTCQSYYLCNLLRNGSFIRTKYPCPTGSYFNPASSLCDTRYKCPCNADTDTSSSSTTEAITIPTSSGTTTEADDQLPTEEPLCNYQRDPTYFTCTNKGRFENLNDLGCESYFLCNLLRNGSFVKTRYSCPKGSRFNPSVSLCDDRYACPCESHTSILPSSTTDASTALIITTNRITEATSTEGGITASTEGHTCRYAEDPDYFVCADKGRFENLNDVECHSYFLCNLLSNGSYIRTIYNCPIGSRFNPSLGICDTEYNCPCSNQATATAAIASSTTTTSSGKESDISTTEANVSTPAYTQSTTEPRCVYEEIEEYFHCSKEGRFVNLNDLSCSSYYLCNLLRNETFIKTKYPCPKGSRFNPNLSVCDTSYTCPCENRSVVTTESSTEVSSTEAPTPPCSTSAPTQRTCEYEEDPDYFTCTTSGAFDNQNDPTCQTYFLCSLLRNLTLLKTKHSCPSGFFNPYSSVCDSSFICPCASSGITTSITPDNTESGSFLKATVTPDRT